jgi:hypothetical protein
MGFDVLIRLFVIFLAMIQPIVILLVCGEIISFSASWQTELQPLYIITNAATSYFLYSVNKWRPPAILLLLLTAFSVITPLYSIKRFRHYMWLFLATTPILPLYGLFWFEFASVWVLCFYHLNLMWETRNLWK